MTSQQRYNAMSNLQSPYDVIQTSRNDVRFTSQRFRRKTPLLCYFKVICLPLPPPPFLHRHEHPPFIYEFLFFMETVIGKAADPLR